MSSTFSGLKKWCLVITSVAILFMASLTFLPTSHALAATVSTHTHAHPNCVAQHVPHGCYSQCYAAQEGFTSRTLGSYILETWLYIGYDSTTGAYCGWSEALSDVYQPAHQPVGTLYNYACGNGCGLTTVAVSPRSSGTWWISEYALAYPGVNQNACAYAVYESLTTTEICKLT